jgi:hypothetical protein
LLPQIYVRRVLEAVPQLDADQHEIGLLLVGRGHAASGRTASIRREQEYTFQMLVRQALLRVGFDDSRVVMGWLRHPPTVAQALNTLVEAGCKFVYWMPSIFPADGINTLFDVPAQIDALAVKRGIKLFSLGGWDADDLAAEEVVAQVRAASGVAVPPS